MSKLDRDIAWVDFARGVADPETDREIRRLMTSGSETDKKDSDLWRRVAAVGRHDIERQVPHDLTRIVKAMGSVYLPRPEEKGLPALRRMVAELTFGGGPQLVGVRSSSAGELHSVFKSESYVFDVRVESLSGGSCRLDGQVYLQDDEGRLADEIPVYVYSGDELLTSTWCNEHGEFHSGELPQSPSKLHLLVEKDLQVELPLSP